MMIAARNAFLMSGAKPWQNPYITDGLVAMWDGEWNAGGGVHDATATAWRDIVRDIDAPYSIANETPNWGAQYWESVSASDSRYFAGTVPSLADGNGSTIEFVVEKIGTARGVVIGAYQLPGGNGCSIEHYSNYKPRAYYAGSPDLNDAPNNTWPLSTKLYFLTIRNNDTYSVGNQNGALNTKSSPQRKFVAGNMHIGCDGRVTALCFYGRIYCIRLYSRALTAAEVAANYAVDKARFGL